MDSVFVRGDHTEMGKPENMLLPVRGKIIADYAR